MENTLRNHRAEPQMCTEQSSTENILSSICMYEPSLHTLPYKHIQIHITSMYTRTYVRKYTLVPSREVVADPEHYCVLTDYPQTHSELRMHVPLHLPLWFWLKLIQHW